MKKFVFLYSMLVCLLIPIVASSSMIRAPTDDWGNILLSQQDKLFVFFDGSQASIIPRGPHKAQIWENFGLMDFNTGDLFKVEKGLFEISQITGYDVGNSSAVQEILLSFTLDLKEKEGVLRLGDDDDYYTFTIKGNKHNALKLMNFDVVHLNDDSGNTTPMNPVPEPASILLIGTGLIGLVGVRRWTGRKKKSSLSTS